VKRHAARQLRAWLIFDVGRKMPRFLFQLIAVVLCTTLHASPASFPPTRDSFAEFQTRMVPMYGDLLKAIDARMPNPRDPQLKIRRRDIDGLLEAIRTELTPKIARRLEKETDLGALIEEFGWLSDLVTEFEIQIDRYVMRAVTVRELMLDLGLHDELETFAAFSSSYRHAFGPLFRQRYGSWKAKDPLWDVWRAVKFKSPLPIALSCVLLALLVAWIVPRIRRSSG
jgi:hypothetical protein